MYISEIEPNTVVSVTIGMKDTDHTVCLSTNAVETYARDNSHAVIVEAIRYKDKVLSFGQCIATAEIVVDGRLHKYQVKRIVNIKHNDRHYNIIESDTDAKPVNRRNAFRCQMTGDAVIRLAALSKTYQCYTRDISATGISFVLNEPANIPLETELAATFESQGLRCNIKATVKRVTFNEETGKTLVGCKFKGTSTLVEQIVATLMRKQARRNKGDD